MEMALNFKNEAFRGPSARPVRQDQYFLRKNPETILQKNRNDFLYYIFYT